jgi:hypothetical protein
VTGRHMSGVTEREGSSPGIRIRIQYVFEARKVSPDKKTIEGEIFRGVAQILVRRLAIACKVSPSSNLGSAPHGSSSC